MYMSVEFLSPYCILRADEYSERKKKGMKSSKPGSNISWVRKDVK